LRSDDVDALDTDDPFSDPIVESNDRKDFGDREGAYKLLIQNPSKEMKYLIALARRHLMSLGLLADCVQGRPEHAASSSSGSLPGGCLLGFRIVPSAV